MDGVDVSVFTGCVYLVVDKSGEMHATTVHEIIAMTAEEHPDLKNVTTEVESIQQWKANLLPVRIVYGTKSGEILDPENVEKGPHRELSMVSEHNVYEFVKNGDARGGSHVHAKLLQDTRVRRSDADWQQRS